jgi:DNA-binding NarL/FixJ family response regulator
VPSDHYRVRLLLADDHPDILEEISNLLSPEFDVIGTAADGIELVLSAQELRPDVVVTDIRMPRLSGIEASRRLLDLQLCKAVVVLTMYRSPEFVKMALDAGIGGYVLKETAGEDLVHAIRSALQGRPFISEGII